MKALLSFCFIACVHASLHPMVNGWVDFGPYDTLHKTGNVSNKYVPLTNDDRRASKRGAQFIHEVKRFFRTGFYTLPPLDPYYKHHMTPFVIADEKNLWINTKLDNFNVTGLIGFTSDLLEIRYGNGRVDYRVHLPQLLIDTAVHVDLFVGRLLPFRTDGVLSVLLNEVVVRGALQVMQVPRHGHRVYQLQGQHTRLHVDDIKAKFVPYLKEPVLASNAVGYNSESWNDCLHVLLEHINEYIAKLVLHQANEILDGPSVDQINGFLLGPDLTL